MATHWEDFLTEQGKSHWEFFKKHDLGRFYCPMMGNLQINNDDWETVKESVIQFIAEYWEEQWVLSHNADCEQWFVHQLND